MPTTKHAAAPCDLPALPVRGRKGDAGYRPAENDGTGLRLPASLPGLYKAKGGGDARKVARLEAENTRARLEEHERKLALAEVRAPIAGVVVAAERTGDKPLARGRPVAQGELLVNIADFERISVLTNVDEVDVGKIEAGQRAWITGPGFPDLPTSRPAPSTPPPPAR